MRKSDLCSLGGKRYGFVIVDDFSRFTWVLFLSHGFCDFIPFEAFRKFRKKVHNEKDLKVVSIKSDHGGEFENVFFKNFDDENGISHNFACLRIPQNGVVERKNRSLQEMARTLISESGILIYFWAEAVSTTYYIMNRVSIRKVLRKTHCELWK